MHIKLQKPEVEDKICKKNQNCINEFDNINQSLNPEYNFLLVLNLSVCSKNDLPLAVQNY